jgi:xylulokinase
MASLVLGLDVGTTSTKAVLADPATGTVLAQASAMCYLSSPRAGWAEAQVTAADIAAVATTGMVPAVVVTDDAATPLRPAILQNDARAVREIRELSSKLSHLDVAATERARRVVSNHARVRFL